jgi:hypothetical protein
MESQRHPLAQRAEYYARTLASIMLHGARTLPPCTMDANETKAVTLLGGAVVNGSLLKVS